MFLVSLFFSILLLLANLFFGKLFYSSFKANFLHYIICTIVALATCICFTIIFKVNSVINKIEKIQLAITHQSLDTSSRTQNAALDAQKFLTELQQENGMIAKLLSAAPTNTQLGNAQDYVNAIGNKTKSKLKSYRNRTIAVLTFFQLIAFIFVGVSASKSGKGFVVPSYNYNEDSGYY